MPLRVLYQSVLAGLKLSNHGISAGHTSRIYVSDDHGRRFFVSACVYHDKCCVLGIRSEHHTGRLKSVAIAGAGRNTNQRPATSYSHSTGTAVVQQTAVPAVTATNSSSPAAEAKRLNQPRAFPSHRLPSRPNHPIDYFQAQHPHRPDRRIIFPSTTSQY